MTSLFLMSILWSYKRWLCGDRSWWRTCARSMLPCISAPLSQMAQSFLKLETRWSRAVWMGSQIQDWQRCGGETGDSPCSATQSRPSICCCYPWYRPSKQISYYWYKRKTWKGKMIKKYIKIKEREQCLLY